MYLTPFYPQGLRISYQIAWLQYIYRSAFTAQNVKVFFDDNLVFSMLPQQWQMYIPIYFVKGEKRAMVDTVMRYAVAH